MGRLGLWLLATAIALGTWVAIPAVSVAAVQNAPAQSEAIGEVDEEAKEEAKDEVDGENPAEPAAPPAPPATDIFMIDLDTSSQAWQVGKVRRVTDRDAYDNQPYFEAGGESLLYTAAHGEQTEILRYSIDDGATERMTETAESEYSPTPIPGWPGFSTVRVAADGSQRLWRFCVSGGCSPEIVFEDIQPVGYHAWIGEKTVAMFVLGEPHELVIADVVSQEAETAATDIGRALHRVPGKDAASYVDKSSEFWTVTFLDLATGKKTRIVQTPPESEDFVWWSERELLIGHGSKLYLFDLDRSDAWEEVADLSGHRIAGITRLSASPNGDRLALVAERR